MSTNDEKTEGIAGNQRLHRNNAAEWLMTLLIAPAVYGVQCWTWLKAKLGRVTR